jgi:WhiB family redox-sensing transcriptional regulator
MNQPGTRREDLPETAWASDGLCAEMPAEIFDAGGSHVQTAKAACAHCTVARQCLRWAITTEIEDEVWGGRTPAERRRISVAFVLDPPPRSRPDVTRPVDVAALPNATANPAGPANARSTPRVKKLSSPGSSELTVRAPKPRTSASVECGTEAGYKRHRRLDEETCADCRRGVREAQADRAARHAAGIPVATRAKVAPCGTPAGYARHRNRGEDACDSCTQANSTYLQAYRAQTRQAS